MTEPSSDQVESTGLQGWAPPVVIYLGVLLVLLLVSWQVVTLADPGINDGDLGFAGDWFWDGWVRFDAGWYRRIAEDGYTYVPGAQSSVAFFPAYPLLIRYVGGLIDNVPLGGILTTIGCGLASMILFWRWCRTRLHHRAALLALVLLAVFPWAWFLYGAVYNDAMFLAAALAAFLLAEHDRPVLAGLAGIVATATRLVGVAVVLGLVLLVLERRGALDGQGRLGLPRRVHVRRLRPRDLWVLVSVLGLAAWSAWLWNRFGDPLLFSSVQRFWDQPSEPRTWFKVGFFDEVVHGDRAFAGGLLLQALAAFAVLALTPRILRRFGLAYAAFSFTLVAIPLVGTSDFQSLGRYCLSAFPAFALLGELLAARPRFIPSVVAGSATALVLGSALFARGTFVA